jgi:hypothetical protein
MHDPVINIDPGQNCKQCGRELRISTIAIRSIEESPAGGLVISCTCADCGADNSEVYAKRATS